MENMFPLGGIVDPVSKEVGDYISQHFTSYVLELTSRNHQLGELDPGLQT